MTTGTQCVSWDADRSCLAGFFNDRSDLFWHYLTSSLERYLPTPQGCMYILMNLTNFVKFISTTFASLVLDSNTYRLQQIIGIYITLPMSEIVAGNEQCR